MPSPPPRRSHRRTRQPRSGSRSNIPILLRRGELMSAIVTRSALCLMVSLATSGSALAFAHANRFGGGTAHAFGATSHVNAFGGSTTHVAGVGTTHRNAFGGGTVHSAWGGTAHRNMYGGTTYGRYGDGAVHTTPWGTTAYASAYRPPASYYGYHPPTVAGYYHAGCYYCGYG